MDTKTVVLKLGPEGKFSAKATSCDEKSDHQDGGKRLDQWYTDTADCEYAAGRDAEAGGLHLMTKNHPEDSPRAMRAIPAE
jgi:hypothetical protein